MAKGINNVRPKEETLEDRLLRLGYDENPAGCWEWKRSKAKRGRYGQLTYRRKLWKAHRAAYTVWRGEIPEGLFVCHTCDNPPCINPDHLFLGTASDNNLDKAQKGRAAYPYLPGELSPSAKLTEEDVRNIRHLISSEELSLQEIGDRYGVTKQAIWLIKRGRTWTTIQ